MRVIYWSDFNCPNSYIGLHRLKSAIGELDLDAEWDFRSFELEPTAFKTPVISAVSRYAIKYGLTDEDALKKVRQIEEIAFEDGLILNYVNSKITNSRDAHRLIKFAKKIDIKIAQELVEKIYEANFGKNEIIADHNVLLNIASSLGFDEKEVREILESDVYDIEVQIDEEDARFYGIDAIPCYVLNIGDEQLTIPGAFSKEDFKIAIEDMISGEIKNKTFL